MALPHDIAACNMVANLLALSRLHDDFSIEEYYGSRDCFFFFKQNDRKLAYNPDLYFSTRRGESTHQNFVEIDTGSLSPSAIRRKAQRTFGYYASYSWREYLGLKKYPRTLYVCTDSRRLTSVAMNIRMARANYEGKDEDTIRGFPFWLCTYEDIDLFSIDAGRVSEKALEPNWTHIDGERGISPFDF